MAMSTANALKAIQERRKKEQERKKSGNQTTNTASGNTTNTGQSNAGATSVKKELSTNNALNTIRKMREAAGAKRPSGATYSSAPSSSNPIITTKKPTDYSSTVKYLQDKGVQGASGIMTENEWRRRNRNGGTYQNYLDSVVSKYEGGATTSNPSVNTSSNGTTSSYDMTKAEYDMRRSSNPSLPEYGSYEYYKSREEALRPIMKEISEDFDRQDPTYKAWVENYEAGLMPDNINENTREMIINLSKKFKYQDSIIAEYKDINEQLQKFDTKGIHYDELGEIDAKSGAEESKYAKERYQAIVSADPLTNLEMVQGFSGELPEDKQKEYNAKKSMALRGMLEADKEDAYNYYEKNKDNTYQDNLGGRFAGNYKLGRIGIKSNAAGYTSYLATTDDIEATEVYQALSARIQNRNAETFKNNGGTDEIIAIIGQYVPQGVDQAVIGAVGRLADKLAGTGNLIKSTATAGYMYEQTAGATYVRLLQESDLSLEDAKKLASSEALSSAAVEFGLDFATSSLFSKAGTKIPVANRLSGVGNTLTKKLVSKGISEKGAKTIVNVAKNAGKLTLHSLGDGAEEWWQEGISITADRYATEGETASPFKLLTQSLWLPQYSKDDFNRMGKSFLGGSIIGFGQGGFDAVSTYGINKVASIFADTNVGQSEQQTATEQPSEEQDSLEQAARDVVASRNATQTENTEPISNVSQTEDSLPTQEENPLKTENKPFYEESKNISEESTPSPLEVAQKEAEAKAIEAAFEAGKQNVPREKVTLATPEQEEAYNNGRIEHIKNMPKESQKVPNIDNKSKQAYNISGKITDKTKNALDKNSKQKVVGTIDGRSYISDTRIAIPIAESDVEYVKSEWGLTDNENIARVVEEMANNEYVPISTNPIEGSVPNIKSAVYVFTTDDGRQIAIQKKYAKYFDGYNLSATFVKGMPYAIKATDAEGNFAGLVMGIRPMDNKTYSLTDTKEVSMKSFKNKPAMETASIKEQESKTYNLDAELDNALRSGSGFVDGKKRIINFYKGNTSATEAVNFLKKEYGQGGRTYTFPDGTWGSLSYDSKGIKISAKNGESRLFSWNEADKRIRKLIESGEYSADSNKEKAPSIEVNKSKQIDEDMHIDNRTWEDVGNRQVKAFQYLFPEFKEYYTPLAHELLSDLKYTIKGERIMIGSYQMGNEEWTGVSRYTSDAIARIKDATNATYDDIENALHRLINDDGQENVALAKRIELVIDDMLTEGYTTFDGMQIPADEEYIAKKEALLGKTQDNQDNEDSSSDDDWDWLFDSGADTQAVERDEYTSPEYETIETRKPIVATDLKADEQRRVEAAEKYGLSHDEANMLGDYVGGQMCYILNRRMNSGTLVKNDSKVVDSIRNALLKMPEYSGRTYRNLQFKTEKEYNDFMSEYSEGNTVELKAFTSTSKLPNGYPLFGNRVVHLVIDGVSGRDIADTFGLPRQQEVLYLPDTAIEIKKVMVANDGNPLIFAQEVKSNENTRTEETGNTGDNRPKTGIHRDINGRRTESDGNARNNNGVQREVRSGNGRDGVLSKRGESAEGGNVLLKTNAKETQKKAKVVETTTKLNDFGEKIGGARKDQWNSRGLLVDDLDSMNDRERDKNVKKDNVWKRPNYRALVEAGGDRGLLWAVNEIRKSLQQNVYYGYNATAETKAEKQKLFIETIRAIQSMAENAKTKADLEAMGEKWLIENGYLEDTGRTYSRYAYTQKFSQNPALSGSNYLNNIRYLAKNFDNLTNLADRNQFAVDTKSVVPKGFSIIGGEGSVGSKLVNGEWVKDTSYAVAKGRFIVKDGFATREEALEWIKKGVAKKKGKTRFVPQQLLEVHRKGPDYRNSKSVKGQDYIDAFGFKGGEFGNWMNAKDRQVSLDYGFDALKDLADALGIEDADISFGGNLNIAFGARGQGLSGAAAHYENERRVINLTKMNGAGSLGHEWFHALDDFIGGYTNNYATDKYYSLPEKTKQAIRDLITIMQYKDATQEETDLAKQKQYEQAARGITYTIESEFKWVEPVENGTFKESDAKYYKRKPTKNDAKKYRELFNKLIETGEMKYVEELSNLRKEVNGRVIPKEVRDSFVWRLASLTSAKTAPIQRARKMTDFYTNSRTFGKLHSKDGDYWDSTVEMSARAFACYVADKTNKQNDYLTAHSDSAITLDTDKDGNPVVVRAYPFGEERIAINNAFDNLIEALKEDGFLHKRTQTEKPAEVSYGDILSKKKAAADDGVDKFTTNKNTDKLNDNEDDDKLAMWTTTRVGNKVKPKSISEIVATIDHKLGINITTGHIQGKGVLGQYDKNTRGIRTKIANNLPIISHELGHYFERTLDIQEQLTEELANELTSNLDERTINNYPEEKLVREGVAEFTRRFLQNRETAAIDYPLFTDFFLSQLSSKDLAIFEQLADDINAYYSLDADTATSSIRLAEEGNYDLRTPIEKLKEKASSLYQAFIDSNHAIKRFDRATGSNAYMLATNAAYSDAIAGQIVTGDLTDINGQYVSSGLKTVLNGLDLNNKEEYRLFGEYLKVKHGPERLQEGKRVFADDKKNNTNFMERRQAELEAQYPQFEEISERLYGFIRKFYQTWAVDTGLLPKETLEFLNNRWEYYVPFNRVMEKGKGKSGTKRGFANQNSTLKYTSKYGSGRDTFHPVDSLIDNIVRMVTAGVRNNVMVNLTNSAEKLGADATFLEPVPMPLTITKMDMTDVKEKLTTWLEESDLDTKSKDTASGVVNNLDDVLFQYGRGKAHGNVVTVLKDGKPQAWKINDVELLQSLTSLSPKTMDGLLDAIAITSRFMTANITGNNIVWSIFSNLPRDIGTFFTYSKNKNVVKMARGVGSAYLNKVKGDKANPLYKEFLAMGGGKTSAYTADRNLAKDVRKKISGRKFNPNPLDWIGYVSDTIEAGPRFATYKMMREAGMTPQEAFYESMDITTNFRRSGRISKDINKAVPFFNASVQGLDKFRRWITAEEVKGAGRKKAIRNRTISFVAVSAALAAIMYAINNGDDEKEEQYEQLSSFIKNSYWVFPVGDGKYFAIPKPREIGVLSSFFERCMELGIGENDHAFDEFYDYASENFLPAIANDIVQIPTKGFLESGMGIIGSLGLIGVVGYLGANRDFLGRPIVASGLQNLEPKDQYTDRTSKIAYWLGQAFNGSPEQIDYFVQQILGGWWKYQKALFPVGEKNVDWSLGVGNTYIKDNQYSTDLTNWLYDRADTTAKSKNSNPDDMEKAIMAKWDSNMVDFYGTYYKKAKAESNSVSARSTRQLVLDILREYQKGIDGDYKTSWQEAVENVCKAKGSTEYMPSVMSSEITDGNDKKHSLSDVQYVEYQTDYLRLYWEIVEDTMSPTMTTTEKAEILTAAKTVAREQATERTLKRIGATSSKFATKYEGVDNEALTEFLAGVSKANDDNKVEKKEVVNVISGLDVDNDDAWTLYLSKYDSKTALAAEKYGIDAKLFMTAVVDMGNIKADYRDNGKVISGSRRAKIERYLNSVCSSYKEYLFLLGTEYDSVKDDYDYVQYFGKE